MLENALVFKKMGGLIFRASGYKPRTVRSWSGMYHESKDKRQEFLDGLVEIANLGMIPATEVRNVSMAKDIIKTIKQKSNNPQVLIWIGSRMQEHLDQDEIGELVSTQGGGVYLMIKNQPWKSEKHWLGILSHVLGDEERAKKLEGKIILCHRGFDPGTEEPRNPNSYRNPHDLAMALRVKETSDLSMIIDPSHIGGTTANVEKVIEETLTFSQNLGKNFDGFIIETRIDPGNALTDSNQHLTWDKLAGLILKLYRKLNREDENSIWTT